MLIKMLFLFSVLVLIGMSVWYYIQEKKKQEKALLSKINDLYLDELHGATTERQIFTSSLAEMPVTHPAILEWKKAMQQYIVWLDNLLHTLCIGLLTGSHILIEGVPGLAKTKTVHHLAQLLNANYKRIQCTPDMLPSDITWWEMYNPENKTFSILQWPIFANIVLADEINRTTPKVQAALLEAMQEWQVTIAWQSLLLPSPFFVFATQNPLEYEWTYLLPEAQLDRFLCKVIVTYPSLKQEKEIVYAQQSQSKQNTKESKEDLALTDPIELNHADGKSIISLQWLQKAQQEVDDIRIADDLIDYIVRLVDATRQTSLLRVGASPRASLGITRAAKAAAYMAQRTYVTIEDIQLVAISVLRHRVIPSRMSRNDSTSTDEIIQKIAWQVPAVIANLTK
jgi:MoxR-like ATPase